MPKSTSNKMPLDELKPQDLAPNTFKPIKKRRLSLKQEGFIQDFLETKNGTKAALKNYDTTDPAVANAISVENLQKPSIQERIRELKTQYIDDSFIAYEYQKQIMEKSMETPKGFELANKIANKIQDRAGFTPIYRQENKTMSVKYSINRGLDE